MVLQARKSPLSTYPFPRKHLTVCSYCANVHNCLSSSQETSFGSKCCASVNNHLYHHVAVRLFFAVAITNGVLHLRKTCSEWEIHCPLTIMFSAGSSQESLCTGAQRETTAQRTAGIPGRPPCLQLGTLVFSCFKKKKEKEN